MRRLWTAGTIVVLIALAFWVGYWSFPLLQGTGTFVAAAPDNPAHQATDSPLPEDTPLADDRMRAFWEAWDILERDFYGSKPDALDRAYGAIRGLTETFDDPYTYFLEPQPRQLERDELRGRFGGVGANIERTDAGYVLYPLVDQPAARAGIQSGDLLLRVDDDPIPPEMESDQVVARVRGPVGSTVTLTIRRTGADTNTGADSDTGADTALAQDMEFAIERAEIETPSLEWRLLEVCAAVTDADMACTAPGAPRVGYIRHTLFSERSPAEMEVAITELQTQGAVRFILDLRGNPGGLVSSAVGVADLWLDGGPVYIEQRASGSEEITHAEPGALAESLPLVIIVDGSSASASEIVAGALQDQNRARLIGEQTYGKGSVQLIHELSDQSSIHVTNAEWFTPNRRRISPDGLTPDVVIVPGSDPLPQAVLLLAEE
ncbi:MAG: S41 family peptidase [Litorilinea sp.]